MSKLIVYPVLTHCPGRIFFSVLRIHEILIRIRGFIPLTDGSGSGSCYYRQWPSRRKNKKFDFFLIFFSYYILKVHLHNFSKIKSHKEVTKQIGINVFLNIFDWWEKDPDPELDPDLYLWLIDPDSDPGGSKHMDPTDPDPQHWFFSLSLIA